MILQVVSAPCCKSRPPAHLTETRLVVYLAESYRRSRAVAARQTTASYREVMEGVQGVVVQQLATALREPLLYPGQDLQGQLAELLEASYELEQHLLQLLERLAVKVRQEEAEGGPSLESLLLPLLASLKARVQATSMVLFSQATTLPIHYFLSSPILAKLFILDSHPPPSSTSGKGYEESLLGSLLQRSCLPSLDTGDWDFFSSPSSQPASSHGATEARIWAGLESVHAAAHGILRYCLQYRE